MKIKRTLTILAAALIAAFVFGACSSSVAFDKEEYTVTAGQELVYSVDTGLTYTLSSDDPGVLSVNGKTVTGVKPGETTLRVNAGGYKAEAKVTVIAAETLAAPTLIIDSKTETSITVKAVTGAEYSKDGGEAWQDSNLFTGLTKSTEYQITARIKATDTKAESPAAHTQNVKTYEYYNGFDGGLGTGAFADVPVDDITVNADGTVTVRDPAGAMPNYDMLVRFGNQYKETFGNGFVYEVRMYIDPADYAEEEGFTLDFVLRTTPPAEPAWLSETLMQFSKYSDGVRIGYSGNAGKEAGRLATENSTSKITAAGYYTITADVVNEGGIVFDKVTVKNDAGTAIFSEKLSYAWWEGDVLHDDSLPVEITGGTDTLLFPYVGVAKGIIIDSVSLFIK